MKLDSYINSLSSSIEIDSPPLEEGSYSIHFEDDISVSIKAFGEEGYAFHAIITALNEEELDEALLETLLQGNLFGQLTGGATLCLSPENGELCLKKERHKALNEKEFIEDFEDFVNYIDFWKEEIPQQLKKNNEKGLL